MEEIEYKKEENPQQQKVCMVDGHSDKILTFICYEKECTEKSRTLCQDCVLFKQNHKKCKKFLKFDNQGQLQIFDTSKKQGGIIAQQIEQVQKNQKQFINQINVFYQEFQNNFIDKIQEKHKSAKRAVEQLYFERLEVLRDYQIKVESQQNQQKLQDLKRQFDINQISIEKFNEEINEVCKEDFGNQANLFIYEDIFVNIEKELQNFTKRFETYHQKLEEEINGFLDNCDAQLFNVFQNLTNNGVGIIQKQGLTTYTCQQQSIFMSQPFENNQKIQLQFQLKKIDPNHDFFIGFAQYQYIKRKTPDNFPIKGGIQLSLLNQSQQQRYQFQAHNFQNKGQKQLQEVYKEGQTYQFEFCLKKHIFRIQDINKECIVEAVIQRYDHQTRYKYVILFGDRCNNRQNDSYIISFCYI